MRISSIIDDDSYAFIQSWDRVYTASYSPAGDLGAQTIPANRFRPPEHDTTAHVVELSVLCCSEVTVVGRTRTASLQLSDEYYTCLSCKTADYSGRGSINALLEANLPTAYVIHLGRNAVFPALESVGYWYKRPHCTVLIARNL